MLLFVFGLQLCVQTAPVKDVLGLLRVPSLLIHAILEIYAVKHFIDVEFDVLQRHGCFLARCLVIQRSLNLLLFRRGRQNFIIGCMNDFSFWRSAYILVVVLDFLQLEALLMVGLHIWLLGRALCVFRRGSFGRLGTLTVCDPVLVLFDQLFRRPDLPLARIIG